MSGIRSLRRGLKDLDIKGQTNRNFTKECDCMKKLIALVLVLVLLLCLAACGNKLVEGSEKTYYGTVTDRAMSVVNEVD